MRRLEASPQCRVLRAIVISAPRLRLLGFLLLCGLHSLAAAGQSKNEPEKAVVDPCLESTCRSVPLRETLTAIGVHVKYVRGIVGGFEQGTGIAGGARLTTADAIPHVEFRATAMVSAELDRRFDLETVFKFADSRNHADVWFSYLERQNDFYGIGPSSSNTVKNTFATDQRSYQGSFYRDFAKHLQGGVYTQFMNTHGGPGKSTKFPPIAPGLLSTTQILSYGGFLELDARDKSKGLTRGIDLFARVVSNDGVNGHAAFSDYGWLESEFDARGYIPLGSPRTSLALRARAQFKTTKGGSQIPFYNLSYLGGRGYVRGYANYRFRANNLMMASTELRQTVYRKTDHRGVDVFGFADTGQVWGDSRPFADPANQNLSSSNWRSGVGGGLQYRHSRSLVGRLEVGRSNEGVRFYASMSQGF